MGDRNLLFVIEHWPWLKRRVSAISRRRGGVADTEELASTAIARLATAPDATSTNHFKPLATTIADKAAIDKYRRKIADHKRAREHALAKIVLQREGVLSPDRETVDQLLEEIRLLGTGQREALLLKLRTGMNSRQLGEQVGANPSTVRDQLATAVARLRDSIQSAEHQGGDDVDAQPTR